MRRLGLLVSEPIFYSRLEPITAARTRSLIEYLRLDLDGRHVTDLGPGNGASLSVFRAGGAATYFIERNPSLYLYCRLRGFHGKLGNFVSRRDTVPDIAYVRGSITQATFANGDDLQGWLGSLGGSFHIICPWLPAAPAKWFTTILDDRYVRVLVPGYQTNVYPYTWKTA